MTETNVFELTQPGTFSDPLTEVLRNGARTLLGQAVEAEVAAWLSTHTDKLIDDGRRSLCVVVGREVGDDAVDRRHVATAGRDERLDQQLEGLLVGRHARNPRACHGSRLHLPINGASRG